MTAAEMLREDLMRAERRKNEPFRREWAVSNVATLSSKSELLYDTFVLPPVGTNILQLVHKEEDNNVYVAEKEHINVSGNHSLDVLNLSTNDANKATLKPSIDFPLSDDECFIDLCDKEELCDSAMIIPIPQHVKETDSSILEKLLVLKINNYFLLPLKKMS